MNIFAVVIILLALSSAGLAQDKETGSQMVTAAEEKGGQTSAVTTPPGVPLLPKSLEGRWSSKFGVVGQGGNVWSVRIARQDQGVITGTLTFWAASCNVVDAPMSGTYDGEKLTVETSNPIGSCRFLRSLRFNLNKKKDGSFEGVYEVDAGAGAPGATERTATLFPVAE